MSDGYQTIRYERDGDVGTLSLARPGKRNAQNPLMWAELAELGVKLLPDETLRCLVVTGDGAAFSAGIDLVEGLAGTMAGFAERPVDDEARAAGAAAAATFSWIPDLGCASVAAVRGHAYGAGLQLALACDFRIFAEGTKVGLTETRYGLLPDMGATVRLPRIIGELGSSSCSGTSLTPPRRCGSGWLTNSSPTESSTPLPPSSPGAWLLNRPSPSEGPGVRSMLRGTAALRRALDWRSKDRSAASSPTTSRRANARWWRAESRGGPDAR